MSRVGAVSVAPEHRAENATLGSFVLPKFGYPGENGPYDTGNGTDANQHTVLPKDPTMSRETISWIRVLVPVIFSTIILLGVMGNLLVAYVILRRQKMRHVWNLLLLNLAIADVVFLLTCGTFTTVHYVTIQWPFGDVFCRVIQYVLYVTCYVSVYTLVAMSVVRYYITSHGAAGSFINSQRNMLLLIGCLWAVFLVAMVPVAMIYGVTRHRYSNGSECVFSGRREGQRLFTTFFVFSYVLPFLVIVVMYTLLLTHLRKRTVATSERVKTQDRNSHVARVVTAVIVVFAVCWLPLHIHLLVGTFTGVPQTTAYQGLTIVWSALVFFNSALNPLLYNVLSSEFREHFREVVCCSWPSRFRFSSFRTRSTTSTSLGENS